METEVIAGIDYQYLDQVEQLQDRLEITHTKMEQLRIMLGPHAEEDNIRDLPDTLRTRVKQLQEELGKLNEQSEKLLNKLDAVGATPPETANPKINVTKQINLATTIRLSSVKHRIAEPLEGPISLIERFGGSLVITEMTPLSLHAHEIEALLDQTQS